ncbi:hypothetical protein [Amycolatopsis tolypomycina]|nr:hypothetical protein [Amycolatopsis tolypomycina]
MIPRGGIGVVDHSPEIPAVRAEEWDGRLNKHNRLTPTFGQNGPQLPDRAFSYLEFRDGTAALLARFGGVTSGRNNSHALVGPAATLRPHALFLSEWDGWLDGARPMPLRPPHAEEWRHLKAPWLNRAEAAAHADPARLTALVRSMLSRQDVYLTLSGFPEPLLLLTAAHEVLDPALSTVHDPFDWTYSTYEDSDTRPEASPQVEGAPRFLCVDELPTSGETGRERLGGSDAPPHDSYTDTASALVEHYLKDPRRHRQALDTLLARAHDRSRRLAVIMQHFPERRPTLGGRKSFADGGRHATVPVGSPVELPPKPSPKPSPKPRSGEEAVVGERQLPQPSGPRPMAEPARPERVPALLAQLGEADLRDDVRRELVTRLAEAWHARGEHSDRARLDDVIIGLRRQNAVLFAILLLSTIAVVAAFLR